MLDPTRRFANRVPNYVKYRPRYPAAIIPLLESECGLTSESVIADLGSGTGFLSELFLKHGDPVIGVEPNTEMRLAGEAQLVAYPGFSSVNAVAEATTLPDHSIDFVVAGQAFHWFNREQARPEFRRILKPDGWVVLAWNGFRAESSPMMAAYQQLILQHGTDYTEVRRELDDRELASFFAPGVCNSAHFNFQQFFDYQGLEGRLLSSSFVPEPDDPNYEPMLSDLPELFAAHQKDGKVAFEYDAELYYGQLPASEKAKA